MTTLSVIIPCYDVADYLPTLLASLRRNAGPEVEFLLVDDASTDRTPQILADTVPTIPGARILTAVENRGLSATRNLGLTQAEGDYLAFLDGDDFVAPGYFGQLVSVITELGCEMVRTDHVQVRGRKRSVHRISHGPRGVVMSPRDAILPAERPTSVDAPYAWAGIFSRRVADAGLLAFDETLRTCEDRSWCWRLHLQVPTFAVVGLTGVFYRRGVPTSLTQQSDERQLDFFAAYDQIVDAVLADPDGERFLPKAVRSYCAIICHHLRLAERYPVPVQQRLRARAGHALAGLDDLGSSQVLAAVLDRMDGDRRALLDGLRAAA